MSSKDGNNTYDVWLADLVMNSLLFHKGHSDYWNIIPLFLVAQFSLSVCFGGIRQRHILSSREQWRTEESHSTLGRARMPYNGLFLSKPVAEKKDANASLSAFLLKRSWEKYLGSDNPTGTLQPRKLQSVEKRLSYQQRIKQRFIISNERWRHWKMRTVSAMLFSYLLKPFNMSFR